MQVVSVRARLLWESAVTKGRTPRVVKVRVPEAQAPFFTLPGRAGGEFVSLLWNWGSSVTVTGRDLLGLLAARNGSVIIARRMTAAELRRLQEARCGADHETHAHMVPNETARWRPRRR